MPKVNNDLMGTLKTLIAIIAATKRTIQIPIVFDEIGGLLFLEWI